MFRWIAILMSFLILFASLRDVTTYANYYRNIDFIIKSLCVNRFKPEMKCHGKCALKDALTENHDKNNTKSPNPPQEDRTVFVLPIIENIQNCLNSISFQKVSIEYKAEPYSFEFLEEVFHPPALLLEGLS